jgi:hypothetical protein
MALKCEKIGEKMVWKMPWKRVGTDVMDLSAQAFGSTG